MDWRYSLILCTGILSYFLPFISSGGYGGTVPGTIPIEIRTMTTAYILALGQSNAANHAEPGSAYTTQYPANVRVYCGSGSYQAIAKDPVCNADGTDGSPWIRLADSLVERRIYDNVVIIPYAVGGTDSGEWITYPISTTLSNKIADAQANGITFTHVLWQQGENDAYYNFSTATTQSNLNTLIGSIRGAGVNAPIFISKTSLCFNPANVNTRLAQQNIIATVPNVFAGADTDAVPTSMRYDGCHMKTAGVTMVADMWRAAIACFPGR